MSTAATMTPATMSEPIDGASPRFKARIAGLIYLLVFVTGIVALLVDQRIFVSGNAAATASNLLANETLFHLGWTANLIATACYIAVTALFYELFKPVNRSVSLTAALSKDLLALGLNAILFQGLDSLQAALKDRGIEA